MLRTGTRGVLWMGGGNNHPICTYGASTPPLQERCPGWPTSPAGVVLGQGEEYGSEEESPRVRVCCDQIARPPSTWMTCPVM